LCVFGTFVENWMAIAGGFIYGSSILFCWSMCLFLCQYHALFIVFLFCIIWNQALW
jgi:hypothetical protein